MGIFVVDIVIQAGNGSEGKLDKLSGTGCSEDRGGKV